MNGRVISSSIGIALLVLGFLACATSGPSPSSGVTNTQPHNSPALARGHQCFDLGSACGTTDDCCSELCQNGYCEEQPGAD